MTLLKNESKFIFHSWQLAGCPMQGELWERKKAVKRAYRDALNRVRKGNETMRFNMLRDAKYAGDTKSFGQFGIKIMLIKFLVMYIVQIILLSSSARILLKRIMMKRLILLSFLKS